MGEAELYRLFDSLQKAGFPLGINEYKLLVESLIRKEELGIEDRNALKRFCCALWVKSPADRLRFEAYFDQIIPDTEAEKNHKSETDEALPQKWAKYAVILGGILMLSIGGFWAYWHRQLQKTSTTPAPIPTKPVPSTGQNSNPEYPEKPTPLPTPTPTPTLTPTSTPTPTPEGEDWSDEMSYILLLTGAIAVGRWLLEQRRRKRPNLVALSQKSQMIATLPAQLTTDYFPFTARQMKQTWRYWRCLIRSGIPRELDIDATIRSISRQGFLLEPILLPRRVNRTQLLLLLDFQGSMIPFHGLSHQLAQTALEGGRFHQTLIYYFYNCPQGYLYRDPYFREPVAIADVFKQLQPQYAGVLIVSDGGAIKGYFNRQRSQMIQQFLAQLRKSVRKICWLNPLPPSRWTETTAEAIAHHVPMFELNRQGLEQAISVLRGVAR